MHGAIISRLTTEVGRKTPLLRFYEYETGFVETKCIGIVQSLYYQSVHGKTNKNNTKQGFFELCFRGHGVSNSTFDTISNSSTVEVQRSYFTDLKT